MSLRYHVSGVGTYNSPTAAAQIVRPLWDWAALRAKLAPLPLGSIYCDKETGRTIIVCQGEPINGCCKQC